MSHKHDSDELLRRIAENTEQDSLSAKYSALALRQILIQQVHTNHLLAKVLKINIEDLQVDQAELGFLGQIEQDVHPSTLTRIKIQFQGAIMATPGPITLVTAGQQVTASVVGFDQFGNPFTGTMPTATLTSDDAAGAIVTFDPSTGLTTAVANGVANISATLTTVEGLSLTDSEAVTVAIAPPPTPVLSSIKVAFA